MSETVYAAIDLGTNNCRLLVARVKNGSFKIIDSFSRIVRLGEGLNLGNRLNETAIMRTIEALTVCAEKMQVDGLHKRYAPLIGEFAKDCLWG